jgi:hypothetical protein
MPSPLSVKKNNYLDNPKKSDIFTPEWLSKWLHEIVVESKMKTDVILDPAIGGGSLTKWFENSLIIGIDINPNAACCANKFMHGKFEEIEHWAHETPDLIIVNPPFNSASGRKLYPEVFLRKIHELFGSKIPVIMIAPFGILLNQRLKSARWKYLRDNWEITSIISLPIDTFENVLFHVEIVCFNTSGMKPHYFIPEENLPQKENDKL